jgi:GTP cyclohydrolase II
VFKNVEKSFSFFVDKAGENPMKAKELKVEHFQKPGRSRDKKFDGAIEIDHIRNKLQGVPDFVEEKDYCRDNNSLENGQRCVQLIATAQLPTKYGTFTIAGFYDSGEKKEHTALIKGDVSGKNYCPVRIHSECHTGDVFSSLKCDCREQLEASLNHIALKPCGVLIYLRQEGRGIGLLNKIKAYRLQDLGLDTVEANQYLGLPEDARDYFIAAKIILILKVKSVALLTNNPEKITGLENEGIRVVKRIPIVTKPNSYNRIYLKTKHKKMGHFL